ncbi:MAG: hypothetical protein COW73_05160 [Nitrospirae bacterium CG18_big_fil_WC_8_21_14_2_50_70_55]|nr:hypothetical protein [Deltaproteobacteria bacterium]OIP62961.1 MAG: hypothetical protein AUK30_09255 [Nitrospirae bacterium CG2_30_70_394]PIQ05717.1 MAG: hypothetical protein COW73_05160 [Nitrospirae bacterium CG18_big_fil_WC_8_21_14_2_50_70_55]PIU79530.1 MAG: hypothetical protein COS73_04045 [Nitrospirae bacterium CG06_land_8_20_14_3_00_70_43]PIW83798.1 MAG: hypothetical protein COZ96_01330 [Nitrospirae bacterium CG_4_8_14_3_um_filter_70_85]PIX82221.1 MAG: hypothetical protein COZ33_11970 
MEQSELPLARLEAGIHRLVEALHAARQERDTARAELAAVRSGARQEFARLHQTLEAQECELTTLRHGRLVVSDRLQSLKARLDAALTQPPAVKPPAAPHDDRRTPVTEELTLQ